MKKITTKISINDFMRLWENIRNKNWLEVMPDFWEGTKDEWNNELMKMFTYDKESGSYGVVNDFVMKVLLRNTENTFLPRDTGYSWKTIKNTPKTYVRYGDLQREMSDKETAFTDILDDDMVGVQAHIPLNDTLREDEDTPDGYVILEQTRSYVKSSFVLAWPKVLQKAMESIGT